MIERFFYTEAAVEDFAGFHPYPRFTTALCRTHDNGSQEQNKKAP
ncbi:MULTISPECIES: hypothetical protein [Streptomyces]